MEELYDRVVDLKMQIKSDKQQLIELHTLFSYVSDTTTYIVATCLGQDVLSPSKSALYGGVSKTFKRNVLYGIILAR